MSLSRLATLIALASLAACSDEQPQLREPQMLSIPGGSFRMGCVEAQNCQANELPVRQVQVPAFELAAHEVSFAEWDACVADGGCEHAPGVPDGVERGAQPVFNVGWLDVQQYISWLNGKTGSHYRLPSEAEWEYAARAGSEEAYYTGRCLGSDDANFDASRPLGDCPAGEYRERTLAVGSLPANPWGLHDMLGNVAEWTEDCWHVSYANGAPLDGSAWTSSGDCSLRVVRGGGFYSPEEQVRAAFRDGNSSMSRYGRFGFRLARSLPQ